MRHIKALLLGVVISLVLAGIVFAIDIPVITSWFVASEKITVSTDIVPLTSATFKRARTAQVQVEGASIYWSCDVVGFTIDQTSGFTANPMTPIWLDSPDKIRNFRAIRSGGSNATIKVNYFE